MLRLLDQRVNTALSYSRMHQESEQFSSVVHFSKLYALQVFCLCCENVTRVNCATFIQKYAGQILQRSLRFFSGNELRSLSNANFLPSAHTQTITVERNMDFYNAEITINCYLLVRSELSFCDYENK